jgi:predicted homoserine dehydrogenase-like protein
MNLSHLLAARAAGGRPVRAGLIGAGKFGSMFLSQVPTIPGLDVACDRRPRPGAGPGGLPERRLGRGADRPHHLRHRRHGGLRSRRASMSSSRRPAIPPPASRHALAAIEAGYADVVMVNVEADVLAGPLLARKAREKGVVYSMAYGDQPALIAEHGRLGARDRLRGRRRRQGHQVPAGLSRRDAGRRLAALRPDAGRRRKKAGMNPQMFNSFLDGTKSAIEMAAIANACGLDVPRDGLSFPPCGVDDLPAC